MFCNSSSFIGSLVPPFAAYFGESFVNSSLCDFVLLTDCKVAITSTFSFKVLSFLEISSILASWLPVPCLAIDLDCFSPSLSPSTFVFKADTVLSNSSNFASWFLIIYVTRGVLVLWSSLSFKA